MFLTFHADKTETNLVDKITQTADKKDYYPSFKMMIITTVIINIILTTFISVIVLKSMENPNNLIERSDSFEGLSSLVTTSDMIDLTSLNNIDLNSVVSVEDYSYVEKFFLSDEFPQQELYSTPVKIEDFYSCGSESEPTIVLDEFKKTDIELGNGIINEMDVTEGIIQLDLKALDRIPLTIETDFDNKVIFVEHQVVTNDLELECRLETVESTDRFPKLTKASIAMLFVENGSYMNDFIFNEVVCPLSDYITKELNLELTGLEAIRQFRVNIGTVKFKETSKVKFIDRLLFNNETENIKFKINNQS